MLIQCSLYKAIYRSRSIFITTTFFNWIPVEIRMFHWIFTQFRYLKIDASYLKRARKRTFWRKHFENPNIRRGWYVFKNYGSFLFFRYPTIKKRIIVFLQKLSMLSSPDSGQIFWIRNFLAKLGQVALAISRSKIQIIKNFWFSVETSSHSIPEPMWL